MAFDIVGFDSNYKVPRFAGRIDFGAGRIATPGQLKVLLCGMKTSAGSLTPNQDVVQVFTEDEVDTKCGAGSQLARMCYAAMRVPGIELWVAPVTEPAGTAATATITIAGAWTTAGQIDVALAGEQFSVATTIADTPTTVAANIVAAITARSKLPFTATNAAGIVTVTVKNLGVQGKDWMVWVGKSLIAAGMTAVVAGSAAEGTDRARFGAAASGTGTEDVTTVLTKLLTQRYARIGALRTMPPMRRSGRARSTPRRGLSRSSLSTSSSGTTALTPPPRPSPRPRSTPSAAK